MLQHRQGLVQQVIDLMKSIEVNSVFLASRKAAEFRIKELMLVPAFQSDTRVGGIDIEGSNKLLAYAVQAAPDKGLF